MSDEIESLRAEVAALRSELAEQRAPGALTRRRLLMGGLGVIGAAHVVTAPSAGAAPGDNVVLGEDNVSSVTTRLLSGGTGDLPDGSVGSPVLYIEDRSDERGLVVRSSDTALVAAGVLGGVEGSGAVGVKGESDVFVGVHGSGLDGAAGVAATSVDGPAVYVENSLVHALLKPAGTTGPPDMEGSSWNAEAGMLLVDADAEVWLCTVDGPPGTWTRLLREDTAPGRTVPITPFRALDTRADNGRPSGSPAVPGQVKGPLKGGQVVTLDLAGVAPIPATATGIIGNLTAVSPTYDGYVRVAPSGEPFVATALSFTRGGVTGNAFTAKLGPDGVAMRGSGTTSNTYHLVVDITAYIS